MKFCEITKILVGEKKVSERLEREVEEGLKQFCCCYIAYTTFVQYKKATKDSKLKAEGMTD